MPAAAACAAHTLARFAPSSTFSNRSAPTGQAATHAGESPSARRPAHRSHLRITLALPAAPSAALRTNRITPNGQASTQKAQPMHFDCSARTGAAVPSRQSAPVGQTRTQGASSQCRHCNGTASPAADST